MSSCFCTGPIMGMPACPCEMRDYKIKGGRWIKETDAGPAGDAEKVEQLEKYMESIKNSKPCISPQHNPPMNLYVPPGQEATHTCPACGITFKISSPIVF